MDQRNWDSSCSQRARLIYRWVQDGGDRRWNLWAICGKKAQYFSRKVCYSFSGWDICYRGLCSWQFHGRPEKHESICCDNQAALHAIQAARVTSELVQECQKALNDISTRHAVGLYCVPGLAGVRGNEIVDKLPRDGSVQIFVGPELALGVSRQN